MSISQQETHAPTIKILPNSPKNAPKLLNPPLIPEDQFVQNAQQEPCAPGFESHYAICPGLTPHKNPENT
jgi:hypothetical protein